MQLFGDTARADNWCSAIHHSAWMAEEDRDDTGLTTVNWIKHSGMHSGLNKDKWTAVVSRSVSAHLHQ